MFKNIKGTKKDYKNSENLIASHMIEYAHLCPCPFHDFSGNKRANGVDPQSVKNVFLMYHHN